VKVAIVYDRLNKWGGAERVLLAFHELFPGAVWYTSVWDPRVATFSANWDVHTSWLNKIPFLRHLHEWMPYLMPYIFESFDLASYDLIISISSESAKGVITKPGTIHLNYCLTPTRYLYSHTGVYLKQNPIYRLVANVLRKWDQVAATRPDEMIAISTQVKNRIQKYYNRDSEVIFPPIDIKIFSPSPQGLTLRGDYYLVVSRLVPYKNIDQIVKAFNKLPDKKLVIIGVGSESAKLRKLAGPNITFLGQVEESALVGYYARAKAFIQANIEDFGLAMVEAQAVGIPVIAKRGGGANDIVLDGATGLLYDGKGAGALILAITQFETQTFAKAACRANAQRFDTHIWQRKIMERVTNLCQNKI